MKKRTKRILAMLLASAMILQQGSTVGVLATETEPVSETVAETTAAETTAVETTAQETQAPEMTAETKAPETQATETALGTTQTETAATEQTETAAPQTEQTETPAATEATEATETAAETTGSTEQSEATSQETTAQETTETPAQTEEKTEAAEETATEKATEAATETEAPKTNFTYEDSRVIITAVAEAAANLPQDAQIHADYMAPGTAAYNEAAAALEAAYAGQDVILDYVFYDIYFTAVSVGDGRIEPEAGTVTVSMQFKKAELTPDEDVKVQSYDVVHVENGKAQEVPSTVQTAGDGSVASVGFTSDSFSPYGFVTVGQEPAETIGADEIATIDLETSNPFGNLAGAQNITESNGSIETSITTNGQGVTNLTEGSSYHFDFHVSFPKVDPDQVYYVDLSSLSNYLTLDTTGIPTDKNNPGSIEGLGHYYLDVDAKKLYFVFDETDPAARNVNTTIFLEASASRSDIAEGSDVEFKIGDEEFEFKWYGEQSKLTIKKDDNTTFNEADGTVTFTVTVTSEKGKNVVRSLSDSFKLLSVVEGFNVTVTKQPGNISVPANTVVTGSSFTTTLNPECELAENEYLTFTYSMNIDKSKAVNGLNVVENTAQVIFKDSWEQEKQSDEAKWQKEIEVKRPSVNKEKVSETPTSDIKWRITVEKGEQGLDKDKALLEDSWDFAGLVFTATELESATVTITYNGNQSKTVTGKEIAGAVTFDGQDFKINFETLASILDISDIEKFVLEYTAKVDVKEKDPEDPKYLAPGQTKDVTNTVTVEKDGTTTGSSSAQGTVENDTELGITAQKSHTSIADTEKSGIKKVVWTSELTIKAGSYSKLYLEDALTLNPANIGGTIWGWYDVTGVNEDGTSDATNNSIIQSIEFSPEIAQGDYFSHMKIERGASTWNSEPHEERWIGFKLTLLDSTAPVKIKEDTTITLTYVSYYDYDTVKKAQQNQGEITNTITFYNGDGKIEAFDKVAEGFVKGAVAKETYGEIDNATGKVGWQVTVEADVLNSLYYNDAAKKWNWPDSAYFVDTLPENTKLIEFFTDKGPKTGKVGYNENGNTYGSYPIEDGYIQVSGHTLRVNILEALKKFYGAEKASKDIVFVYQTEISDFEKYVKEGAKDYINEVALYLGDRLPDKAEASVGLNPGANITKTAGTISQGAVSFTIGSFGKLVNNILKTRPGKFTEAKLVDEYGYALRYDAESFNAKLDGKEISRDTGGGLYYTVDTTRHVIEFHIPVSEITDSSTLTYSLKVVPTAEGGTSGGTNTIWLYGYEKSSSKTDVSTSATGAFGNYDATYLSISKTGEYLDTSEDKQNEPLSNVTFELHDASYTQEAGLSYESEVLDSVTTLADGKASFKSMIEANKLYAICETETPEGYQPIDPLYVLCYYNSSEHNPPTPEQIDAYKEMGVRIYTITDRVGSTSGAYITAFTVDIVNSIGKTSAQLALSGTKTLDGVAPTKAGNFSFKVEDATNYMVDGAPEKKAELPKGTTTDGEGGAINISGIKFSAAGTYKLKVFEVAGTDTSIKYDSKTYTVEVKVEPNSDDTAYVVTEVKVDNSKRGIVDGAYPLTETGTATFANITKTDATLALSGTKTLDSKVPATAGNFSFKIEDATDYKASDAPKKKAELPKGAIKDGAGGAIDINGIKFSADGTYKLKVSEVAGTNTSIKYDSKIYTVEVKVESNSSETGYEVTEVKVGVGAATPTKVDAVNNVYPLTPGATTFANTTKTYTDATLALNGTKTLDGVAPTKAGNFSFKVEDATNYMVDGAPEKKAELPKGTTTDGEGGAINISGIKFSAAGTYKLKVFEVAGTDTSIKYDSKTYTVEVKVEPNSDDTAYVVTEVKVDNSKRGIVDGAYPLTETGTATFANITKTDATLALSGTKTLDSKVPATAGNFSFKIEDATDYKASDAPKKKAELPKGAIKDGAGGAIDINGIKFSADGTYKLKVSEVAGTNTSIKYDSKIYTVEVKVESNSSETGYEVTEVKVGVGAATPTKVDAVNNVYPLTPGATTFANTTKTYTDATLALNGTKTLDGAAPKTAGSFTFKVEDVTDYKASGAPEETAERPKGTITDGAGGAINISGIRFSAAGTYKLKVFEVAGTDTTIKYDSKTYTVEVTVTLDKTAASYKVTEVKVGVGAAEPTPVNAVNNVYPLTKAGTATFANTTKTYTDATLALSGTKTLNGAAPEADAFAFKAEATGTNKTDVTITPATVKNGADGSFTFSSIKFAKAGTYTLEISEIPDNVGTVTYDKTSYIVTVTVEPTESGFEVKSVKVGEENLSLVDGKYVLPKQKDAQKKETATFVNSTLVKLDKVDEDNKKIIGAELQVVGKDADGKDVAIEGWTTKSDLHVITGKLELGKMYILKEVSAPKGYKLADPVEFKVGEDGKIYLQGKAEPVEVITMTDAKLHFNVNKTELGTGDEVEGAELTVYEKQADGTLKKVEGASWTSKKGETHDFGDKLEAGKSYKLVEKVAPEGYAYTTDIEFSVGTDGTITTSAKKTSDAQGNDTYLVEDAKLHFNVNKTELGTGDEVEGAELTVYEKQADGTLKKVEGASWTSKKGETHDFGEKLEAGKTYVLREEVAPDGYGYVTDIEFTVEKDGKVTTTMPKTKDSAGNDTYLVEDARIRLEVDKRATGTGEELDGAVLELLDAAGNVVESWTSKKGETHNFGGKLKAGESYTLRETIAPDGYTCVTDMKFTVGKDGTVNGLDSIKTADANGNTVYVVEDTLNKISIQKVDESGAALAGAKLVIKDADGKAAASWTTDGKAHEITGLAAGKYTLSEVEAPEGYQVSKDVPFEITGKEAVGGVIELSMTDTKIPESNKYSLTVTKHLHLDGINGDLAAKEATYYVALFSDEAKTQRVSNVKKIEFKDATSSTVTFDKLAAGTYYVGETDENGTLLVSKIVNDKLIFHPEYTDGGKAELEGKKTEGTAEFTNVYMELPSGFYLSGQITVTKKVLVNGAEGTSDETYYARVFSDKKLSTPASDVLALDLAGGTSASVTVTDLPIGESIDSSMNYYVAETDENGKPLDPDAVTEFEISIDKSEVVLSANNSAQEVVITNNFVEEETETETETETEVEKKEAPKTGDDTDFMRYLLLMALSAGTCAIAFEEKRRRNRARK